MKKYLDIIQHKESYFTLVWEENASEFLFDPDWRRFHFTKLSIEHIKEWKIINSNIFSNIPIGNWTLQISEEWDKIMIFLNFKTKSGTYTMNWYKYIFDINSLQEISSNELFSDKNRWRFPMFESNDIIHFWFDWYFSYKNITKWEYIKPEEFEINYKNHKKKHSWNIFEEGKTYWEIYSILIK